jgi:hypothetical protein
VITPTKAERLEIVSTTPAYATPDIFENGTYHLLLITPTKAESER